MTPLAHSMLTRQEELTLFIVLLCVGISAFMLATCLVGSAAYGVLRMFGVKWTWLRCWIISVALSVAGILTYIVGSLWLSGVWSH